MISASSSCCTMPPKTLKLCVLASFGRQMTRSPMMYTPSRLLLIVRAVPPNSAFERPAVLKYGSVRGAVLTNAPTFSSNGKRVVVGSVFCQAHSTGTVTPVALPTEKSRPLLADVVGLTSKTPVSMYVCGVGRALMFRPHVADGSRLKPASDTRMRGSP